MEIILAITCASLTGTLDKKHGYFIQQRGKRFFGKRKNNNVPPDGHWRFISDCAEMAVQGLFIGDIRVPEKEMLDALREAGIYGVGPIGEYDARRVLELKKVYRI